MTEREKQRAIVYTCFESLDKASEILREHPDWIYCKDGIVGETAFHYLVVENQLEAVKLLSKHGANINEHDYEGMTPLMTAIFMDYREMAEWLLSNGASIEGRTELGWTTLSIATDSEKAWAFQK